MQPLVDAVIKIQKLPSLNSAAVEEKIVGETKYY
jgi:hypothetical protein